MVEQDPKDILLHHLIKFKMKPKYAKRNTSSGDQPSSAGRELL